MLFIQNHDQIGNRAFGERLGMLTSRAKLRAVAAVYLLAPQIPMLFMGEEWNARQPFQFFTDFHGDLAEAVRNGRREEFARMPEFAAPGLGRESNRVTIDAEIGDGATGVLYALGGFSGGLTLFMDEGELVYEYNMLEIERYSVRSSEKIASRAFSLGPYPMTKKV